ncbi:S8 family serine peptidase, partial [candidate division TA06 bacterium]|nr:S8 family serine peptidase [candidate division TA06 bacterium]
MQRKDLRFAWAQIPGVEEYGLFISSTPFTIDKYGVLQGGSLVIKAKRGDPPVWEPDFYYPELKAGHTYYWAIISDIEEPAERRASKVKSFTIGLKPAMASVDRTSNLPKMSAGLASKFSPEVSQNANLISAGGGFTIDTKVGEPKLPQELTGSAAKAGERGYYIVHFNGPIYPQMKEALEKSGAIVYDYLPNYAFIVGMDENIKARVKNIPSCDWTGLYQPAYKFSQEDMDRHLTVNKSTNRAEVVIRFFTEEDLGKNIASLEGMGVKVLKSSESEFNKIARAEVDASKISDIARLPGVCFIEPFVIHKILNNLSIRYMSSGLNTADTTIYTKGVKGQGEIVNISDTGIRMTHQNFKDPDVSVTADGDYTTHRKVIAYKVWKPATFGDYNDGHGTHTVGTICGYSKYGSVTVDSMPGMAKLSKIYFQDVGKADTLYGLPDDLTLLFKQSYTGNSAGGARVSSHSWGSSNHTYTGYCRDVDIFTWKYQDFAVFFSAGNSAGAVDADSIGSPARAKNTVAVGSVGARATGNADDIPGYSSRGRTKPDGRYKPDILAVGGMASFTEAGPYSADGGADAAYVRMSGTSMASPCAAGMGALVRQYFREGWYPTGTKVRLNGFIPSGALIHAVEVASGDTNLSSNAVLPNGAAGWGRIDIDSALYFSGDGRKLLVIDNQDGLITGDAVSYRFNVPSSAANLKIVLVWHDYPAAVGATLPLVNDLNLEVNGAGTIYWGNRYTSGQSTANPTGKRDTANIVEVVRLKAPAAGAWVATINGNNIPYGAQPFALVVVYTQSQFAASVRLDRTRYSVPAGGTVGDTVRIAVVDSFGTATAVDTALVAVWSKYETSPDTVKCIEDTADGNYFIGKIPLRTIAAKHNDGYLSVEQSDSVFASFTDASPAFTDTARARVDLINFVITNVRAENVFNAAADIKWTTSEAATSTVYYDTLTSVGKKITDADQDIPAGEVLSHVITLKGLTPNRLYYYDVESKDHAGNMVRDNNGGRHYTFTTTNNW